MNESGKASSFTHGHTYPLNPSSGRGLSHQKNDHSLVSDRCMRVRECH